MRNAVVAPTRVNGFTASGQLEFYDVIGGAYATELVTTQQFNPSTWYNVVLVYDTTQSAAANRVELFVNGQQITSFSTQIDPAQNSNGTVIPQPFVMAAAP